MELVGESMNEFEKLLATAVRQGDVSSLEKHLSTVTDPDYYLNRIYEEQHSQKLTLLMMACLNEQSHIVRTIVDRYKPDLEILNNIIFGDKHPNRQLFVNVTVLWAATSINNFEIVKLLVEHGAHINHRTKTNSTPIRGACYNGSVDMARFLIQHGADIHVAKENNDTNLMVSVCHKHVNMVSYLVDELNCDVNECDIYRRTSLYDAVISGSAEIIQFLLQRGALSFPSALDRMTPLMWAAEKRRADLVEIISPYCSITEMIEAQELLGSAFICGQRDDQAADKAFEHFSQAIELRRTHQLPKLSISKSHPIFQNREECQTIDQLKKIRFNIDQLYNEALMIRERLLGVTNGEYRYSLCYRGAILADHGQYHEAVIYWIYELDLCQQHSISPDPKHLRRFASLFSGMLHKIKTISMEAMLKVIRTTIEELENDKQNFNENFLTLLFLITVTCQFLAKTDASSTDRQAFYSLVHSVCYRRYARLDSGMSLLHLALSQQTIVNDFHIKNICKYPCAETAKILLQCGASINAGDAERNTPLHVIVSSGSAFHESILNLLCELGAHLDLTNASGQTPMDMATILATKQLLTMKTKLNLKCICARLIQKKHLRFHGRITAALVYFVERH